MAGSKYVLGGCFGVLITFILLTAIEVFVVQFLWNNLVPKFWDGCPILGFWETLGAICLLNFILSIFKVRK